VRSYHGILFSCIWLTDGVLEHLLQEMQPKHDNILDP